MADAENSRFLIRFWGVRGSYPTPGAHTLRHGGNTACVEIQAGRHTLIFDAGTGIIGLGNALMRQVRKDEKLHIAMFITHAHSDHLVGFPFFSPLFDSQASIHLFGPQLAGRSIEELVTALMSPPYFPVDVRQLPSQRTFHTIADEQRIVWLRGEHEPILLAVAESGERDLHVDVEFTRSHPLNGALVYRIEYGGKRIIYATDVEWRNGCEKAFLKFIDGADVLIHDAQYTRDDYLKVKKGFGHSTVDMAIEAATVAHVHELVLFHHDPTYDDTQLDTMEAQARTQFAHTRSACEGMEINLLA